jgi:hypothetical protein
MPRTSAARRAGSALFGIEVGRIFDAAILKQHRTPAA